MTFKIEKIVAFIQEDDQGTEGIICAMDSQGMFVPLIGADIDRVKSYKQIAQKYVNESGRPVRLVEFSNMKNLEILAPRIQDH